MDAESELQQSIWRQISTVSDQFNDPGFFTAFIGYEWSSTPDDNNLYRDLSFHILTAKAAAYRGSVLSGFMTTIRGNQDVMAMLVFGGVFDRYPDLKVVCIEADAGWVPHFMYHMDHAYLRHRHWIAPRNELGQKSPRRILIRISMPLSRTTGVPSVPLVLS